MRRHTALRQEWIIDPQNPQGHAPPIKRALYPIPEAREQLGGISNTAFYELVKQGRIQLTKLGRRSFVAAEEIQRVALEGAA